MGAAQSPILTYGGGIVPGSMLMHLTGANGGTTFTDVYGSTPWGQNKFYESAPYSVTENTVGSPFAGVTSALYTAQVNTGIYLPGADVPAAWNGFGTADFTVEFWLYDPELTVAKNAVMIGTNANGNPFCMGTGDVTNYTLGIGSGGNCDSHNTTLTYTPNTWVSVAYCRQAGKGYLFINGAADAANGFTDTTNYGPVNPLGSSNPGFYVGGCQGVGEWAGYLSEIRITAGFARYTTSYTPATAPFQY